MKLIIKNSETGKYFTDSYRNDFWSREIEDAYLFEDESEIRKNINNYGERLDTPFENIKTIIIETVYKF